MANPFYQPLQGLSIDRGFANALNTYQNRQQQQKEMALIEQQKAQQAQMQDLATRAMAGDAMAANQLFVMNPDYASKIDQRLNVQNEAQQKQVGGFLEKYLTTPKEQRQSFLESSAGNTPFTLDDEILQMNPDQRDAYASMLAGRYLNKEQLAMLGGGAGDATSAQKDFEYYKNLQKTDPEGARQYGLAKGYVETGREAMPTTQERNWETYQNLKKTNPEQAKQFGQSAGIVTKEGRELSQHMQKRLSEATDLASELAANSARYNDLADQLDKSGIEGGLGTQIGEFLKKASGKEDFKSELRRDYFKIMGSEVVKNLPPGAASDADVALAKNGFPNEQASGAIMASFIRGVAKLNDYAQKFNEFKANYIGENGTERGLLKAWKEQGVEAMQPQRGGGQQDLSNLSTEELKRMAGL